MVLAEGGFNNGSVNTHLKGEKKGSHTIDSLGNPAIATFKSLKLSLLDD